MSDNLPPLPSLGCNMDGAPNTGYTASEMQAYARAALTQAQTTPVDWEFDAKTCPEAYLQQEIAQLNVRLAQAQSLPDVPDEFRELLREARDNCQASIAESGVSRDRIIYRKELFERLSAALAALWRLPVLPTKAVTDVLAERRRQISAEGWTPEHDDKHTDDELSLAAASYAICNRAHMSPPGFWPLDRSWWKPSDNPRRNLVKAGALILAEIERLDRAAASPAQPVQPNLLSWAVDRWLAEVSNRPLVNKNRRTLDDTWRQVIRFAGGDPDELIGPCHDTLLAAAPQPKD